MNNREESSLRRLDCSASPPVFADSLNVNSENVRSVYYATYENRDYLIVERDMSSSVEVFDVGSAKKVWCKSGLLPGVKYPSSPGCSGR